MKTIPQAFQDMLNALELTDAERTKAGNQQNDVRSPGTRHCVRSMLEYSARISATCALSIGPV